MIGMKTGGRKKGSLNKSTRELLAHAAAGGELPLDYMLQVMRDEEAETSRRDEMAKAAAPFLHPRLATVEHKQTPPDLSGLSEKELDALERTLERISPRNG
jgi:hypothetical protein